MVGRGDDRGNNNEPAPAISHRSKAVLGGGGNSFRQHKPEPGANSFARELHEMPDYSN